MATLTNKLVDKFKEPSTILLILGALLSFVPGLLVVYYFQFELFLSLDIVRLILLAIGITTALYSIIFALYGYLNLRELFGDPSGSFKFLQGMALVNLFYCTTLTATILGFMHLFGNKVFGVFVVSYGLVLCLDVGFQMFFTKYPRVWKVVSTLFFLALIVSFIYAATKI